MPTQFLWRGVEAKLLARRGDFAEAEALAREAVRLAGQTDALNQRARLALDLAEVLALAGRSEDATELVEEASSLYELKGNTPAADEARRILHEAAGGPIEKRAAGLVAGRTPPGRRGKLSARRRRR